MYFVKPIAEVKDFTGFSKITIQSEQGNWENKKFLFDNFVILRPNIFTAELRIPWMDKKNGLKVGMLPIDKIK